MKKSMAVGFVLSLAAISARAEEPRFTVRVQGMWPSFTWHDVSSSISGTTRTETEGEPGIGVAFEFRPGRLVGLELSGIQSELDQHFVFERSAPPGTPPPRSEGDDSVRMRLATLGIAFHPLPGGPVDLSIGPFFGWALYGPENGVEQDQPTYGAALGLDWPLGGGGWALAGTARYYEARINGFGSPDERWKQMWYFGAGVAWRR